MPVAAGSSTKVEGIGKMGEEGCVRVVGTSRQSPGEQTSRWNTRMSSAGVCQCQHKLKGQIGGEALCIAAVVYGHQERRTGKVQGRKLIVQA
jgi:hypothetical protein